MMFGCLLFLSGILWLTSLLRVTPPRTGQDHETHIRLTAVRICTILAYTTTSGTQLLFLLDRIKPFKKTKLIGAREKGPTSSTAL
jgi:hypothetical protein